MASDATPLDTLLAYVSQELQIKPSAWNEYGQHNETRHEHAIELQAIYDYRPFRGHLCVRN